MIAADWRLVDDVGSDARDGAGQMQADLELLDAARAGATTLRLYTWRSPVLSLGRFQDVDAVDVAACARHGVEVVRRPSGGRALLHGADLTYAVAMPRPPGDEGRVDAVYCRLAGALIAGLATLGVEAAIGRHEGPGGPACFVTQQGADLRVGDRKLCGSAQVQRDGALLQHGSILLRRLPIDETDLLVGAPSRARLRAATVTLEELGAASTPRVVADAVVAGFGARAGQEAR